MILCSERRKFSCPEFRGFNSHMWLERCDRRADSGLGTIKTEVLPPLKIVCCEKELRTSHQPVDCESTRAHPDDSLAYDYPLPVIRIADAPGSRVLPCFSMMETGAWRFGWRRISPCFSRGTLSRSALPAAMRSPTDGLGTMNFSSKIAVGLSPMSFLWAFNPRCNSRAHTIVFAHAVSCCAGVARWQGLERKERGLPWAFAWGQRHAALASYQRSGRCLF